MEWLTHACLGLRPTPPGRACKRTHKEVCYLKPGTLAAGAMGTAIAMYCFDIDVLLLYCFDIDAHASMCWRWFY